MLHISVLLQKLKLPTREVVRGGARGAMAPQYFGHASPRSSEKVVIRAQSLDFSVDKVSSKANIQGAVSFQDKA